MVTSRIWGWGESGVAFRMSIRSLLLCKQAGIWGRRGLKKKSRKVDRLWVGPEELETMGCSWWGSYEFSSENILHLGSGGGLMKFFR